MTMLTINLPEDLVVRLKVEATARHISLDSYVSGLLVEKMNLSDMLDPAIPFDAVLAHVRTLPPRDANHVHPATMSLSEVLAGGIGDSSFDEVTWNREWARVETAIKSLDIDDQQRDLQL